MATVINASFTATPATGNIPLNVVFQNTSSEGSPPVPVTNTDWIFNWTFGDGATASFAGDPTASHVYTVAGTYSAVLELVSVYDPTVTHTSSAITITISTPIPVSPSSVSFSPIFNESQFFDEDGTPLAGGLIYTYAAGSSTTQQATYTDPTGTIANSNPIVLDAAGRSATEMWLVDGYSYNLLLVKPDTTTVLRSCDNVKGSLAAPSGGGIGTVIWNQDTSAPVYVASNQFLVTGNEVINYAVANRVRYQFNDLTYAYAVVTAVAYDGTNTQVTILPDSIGFNNTVINVAWSALVIQNFTVDAGAVGYTSALTYSGANVGAQLQSLATLTANWNRTYTTAGTAPAYTVTSNVALGSYANLCLNIKLHAASAGVPATINVNGLGAIPLKQYDNTGNTVDPFIGTGMMTTVMYDGANMVITSPLPVVPSGSIVAFAANTVPVGWLVCDGSAQSTTTYPSLFAYIGYTFGGSGTSFNLPNLLGRFIRGFDSGGTVDPSRAFGSTQAGSMATHVHGFGWENGDNQGYFTQQSHTYPMYGCNSYINWNGSGGGIGGGGTSNPMTLTLTTSNQLEIQGETRPTNVALLYCIKT